MFLFHGDDLSPPGRWLEAVTILIITYGKAEYFTLALVSYVLPLSVWSSSARQHLLTMLKQQQHKKYSVTLYNLFAGLSTCTSKLLMLCCTKVDSDLTPLCHIDLVGQFCFMHRRYNVFQIAFIVLAGLTFVYYAAFVSSIFPNFLPIVSCMWSFLSLMPALVDCLKFRGGEEKNLVADSNFLRKLRFFSNEHTHMVETSEFSLLTYILIEWFYVIGDVMLSFVLCLTISGLTRRYHLIWIGVVMAFDATV